MASQGDVQPRSSSMNSMIIFFAIVTLAGSSPKPEGVLLTHQAVVVDDPRYSHDKRCDPSLPYRHVTKLTAVPNGMPVAGECPRQILRHTLERQPGDFISRGGVSCACPHWGSGTMTSAGWAWLSTSSMTLAGSERRACSTRSSSGITGPFASGDYVPHRTGSYTIVIPDQDARGRTSAGRLDRTTEPIRADTGTANSVFNLVEAPNRGGLAVYSQCPYADSDRRGSRDNYASTTCCGVGVRWRCSLLPLLRPPSCGGTCAPSAQPRRPGRVAAPAVSQPPERSVDS